MSDAFNPMEALAAEAASTLTYFGITGKAQEALAQQALLEIGNPELRAKLQGDASSDPFSDYDPGASISDEIKQARAVSIEMMESFVDHQLALLEAMRANPVAWFVLRARLVALSVQIDARMAEGG